MQYLFKIFAFYTHKSVFIHLFCLLMYKKMCIKKAWRFLHAFLSEVYY